jgi:hypothetical protein
MHFFLTQYRNLYVVNKPPYDKAISQIIRKEMSILKLSVNFRFTNTKKWEAILRPSRVRFLMKFFHFIALPFCKPDTLWIVSEL